MTYLQLFWSFLKIGFTSFGGLSMIPLISSEMLSHNWMTAEEVSDIVAIAEMTPGPLGVNCATFAGIRTAGFLGAVAANLGVLMPSLTLCPTNYTESSGVSIPAILIGILDTVSLLKFKISIPKVILLSAVLGLCVYGWVVPFFHSTRLL